MSEPVRLLLRVQVREQDRDAFLAFLRRAIPEYELPGGIRVSLLRSTESPSEYIEVVEYATRQDYDNDQRRVESDERLKQLLAEWRSYVVSPPGVRTETYSDESRLVTPAPAELPVLTTTRLVLRAFRVSDAPDIARLANDRRIAEGTLLLPFPYTEEDARYWLSTHYAGVRDSKAVTYAITIRSAPGSDSGPLIGAIGLMIDRTHQRAELGYWLGVNYWKHGYTTEAAQALIHHGFSSLGLQRIFASHYAANPASGRVMQKLGMRQEGTLRRHIFRMGTWHDSVIYGLLRDEHAQNERIGTPT